MKDLTLKQDAAIEGGKSTPAVLGAAYSYYSLNEWVAILTIIYILVQIFVLLHKHYWKYSDRKNGKDKGKGAQ